MDWSGLAKSLHLLWERKPGAVALTALGLVVFLFLVIDAWYHKRRRKRRPPRY
jgi:hypothetical protein